MLLEGHINSWHHLLDNALLHIYRLEQTREPGAKDVVHMVGIVKVDKRGICALGFKVTKEHSGDRSHSLTVPTLVTAQRKAMQDME